MSEVVWRIRRTPTGRDENDDVIPGTVTRTRLRAAAIAPGASSANARLARDGETIEHSIYFLGRVDLTNEDQIEVRGELYSIRVLDWRSAFGTGRRGLVVMASKRRG